jgi:hypothetical protein
VTVVRRQMAILPGGQLRWTAWRTATLTASRPLHPRIRMRTAALPGDWGGGRTAGGWPNGRLTDIQHLNNPINEAMAKKYKELKKQINILGP